MSLFRKTAFVTLFSITSAGSFAFGSDQTFFGDISATTNPDTFTLTRVEVKGEAALALFNTTVAMARIERFDDHTRVVRGGNLSCYEHFATLPFEEPVYYTCEMYIEQGGYIRR